MPCLAASRHVRRRARLGALLPDRVRRSRSGTRSGRRAATHGLVAGGYKAIDSLRLEKGYRVWGADITPDDTPYEAGLGFAVKLDKGDFIGREALLARQEPERRLALPRASTTRARSRSARSRCASTASSSGRVTSGGYGYTVGRSIAYAYLPADRAEPGTPVEVEIFGEWVGGEVAPEPLFDPAGERLRG